MPINNADIPIADNEPEIKIDNPIEHAYLYRVISSQVADYVGLKFYKYKQKFNGLDTFISNNGVYYIWANSNGGNTGQWIISKKIGTIITNQPTNTMFQDSNLNFFTTKVPVEGTYSSFVSLVLGKITSDTR